MSAFVLTNLVVTAGMLQPGLGTAGTIAWQVVNQSLNVAINSANANKSSPLTWRKLGESYAMAVSVSCGVAVGLNKLVPRLRNLTPATRTTLTRLVPFAAVASAGFLNVLLMRGEEMRTGIDVFPVLSDAERARKEKEEGEGASQPQSLGRSKKAAQIAVGETAASRVFNSTPIMVIPPLVLVRLQQQQWLKQRPRLVVPINLALILATSYAVLPLALASISADKLEPEFHGRGGEGGLVVFNRGI
ncbi:tricarboxylate carrier [Colletotrichum tofieldiae]|nr:tricarboxylate carrier [Colletotrichum tofieldiae]